MALESHAAGILLQVILQILGSCNRIANPGQHALIIFV